MARRGREASSDDGQPPASRAMDTDDALLGVDGDDQRSQTSHGDNRRSENDDPADDAEEHHSTEKRYWCHLCDVDMIPLLPELKCSQCGSDFVEEIDGLFASSSVVFVSRR